jgi:prepilin-type N-terminal cleavage/methylation domain-containing protein
MPALPGAPTLRNTDCLFNARLRPLAPTVPNNNSPLFITVGVSKTPTQGCSVGTIAAKCRNASAIFCNNMFRPKLISKSNAKRDQLGFSLIEMAVVLLIIAIVAAFVVPQIMSYMRMYRLGVGGRNVATALQRARYLATSNNTLAGVLVAEVQRVDIEQYDPMGKEPPQNMGIVKLPDGVTIASDAPKEIAFDGRGIISPMPKESPTIRLNGVDGYYLFITVSPTGQVTVSEAKREDRS